MAQTDFNVKEIDPESFSKAQERVKSILGEPGTNVMFTKNDPPAAPPAPAPEPETSKKTRTTVGKLLQRYQDREAELVKSVSEMEATIDNYQNRLSEEKFKLSVWREAIAEINSD